MYSVIFDMDGVILDTERMFLACWVEIARRHDIPNIEPVIFRCIGTNEVKTAQIVTDYIGSGYNYEALKGEVGEHFLHLAATEGIPVKPGVRELLEYLRARGVKVGLASSTVIERVKSELTEAGLIGYFDFLTGGNMVTRSKPEPDIFLYCAEKIGAVPEQTFVLEDSFNGVRAAHNAKMLPIMVPDLKMPDEEIEKLAYKVMPSLVDVRKFFEKEKIF